MNISSLNEVLINNLLENSSHSKEKYNLFIEKIVNSKYLMAEFKTYDNILNFKPADKSDLINYINENIEVIKSFDLKKVEKEHEELGNIFKEEIEKIHNDKQINKSINKIINEKLKDKTDYNINEVYNSYDIIFNELTTKLKPKNPNSLENKIDHEEIDLILKKANTILKEKYSDLLSEEEKKALRLINKGSYGDLKTLFEEWKTKALNEIEIEKESIDNELYDTTINKIKDLSSEKDQIEESLIKLSEILF